MKNIDYDWKVIIHLLVQRFGFKKLSQACEISIIDIRSILVGFNLEPCYSSGCMLIESFKHCFPDNVKDVSL